MKASEILSRRSNPLWAPAVPGCAHRFNRREHLFITYLTDPEALREAVPEPLALGGEPLVRFEVIRMPDATGFGDYTECGQAIPVTLNGVAGEYLHMMFLDNFEAMASGRETSSYPKKLGWPRLFTDGNTLVGTLDYGPSRLRVATATMTYKYYPMDEKAAIAELSRPNYMLKLQSWPDGSPRIAELTANRAVDCEILEAWTGEARLQLFEHVMAPLADLPVKKIVSCAHIITNLSLTQNVTLYDYLAGGLNEPAL